MWKIKGTVRYFISIFAITFVQIGVFIYTQKVIAGTANDQVFLWESLILQGLFLLPYIFMIVPASYFSNKFSKQKVHLNQYSRCLGYKCNKKNDIVAIVYFI